MANLPGRTMTEGPGGQVGWQELTKAECFELLSAERLGRVAVVDDQGPIIFPVNFVLDRHMVVFRTDEGTKLDAAARGSRVAFEIDGTDEAARTGWSVLIRGEATEVTDPAELARLRKLRVSPWAPGAKTHYVRILPAKLTGRRIWAPGGPSHRDTKRSPGTAAWPRR